MAEWGRVVILVLLQVKDVPFVIQEHRDLMLLRWSSISICDLTDIVTFGYGCFKLLRGHAIEGLDQSVVVHDHQLALGDDQRHEEVEVLLASDLDSLSNGLLSAHLTDIVGGLGSMVTVGHKEFWNLLKVGLEELGFGGRAQPQGVNDIVPSVNSSVRLFPTSNFLDLHLDMLMPLESQEHRLGIGVLVVNYLCAVLLLFLEGELMLLDEVVLVVVNARQTENAVLNVVSHLLLVDVNSSFGILDQESIGHKIFKRVFAHIVH
jgi:hypothetical protein